MFGGEFHFFLVAAFQREQRDAAERRIFQLLAEFDFLFVKAEEVVSARVLDGGMKRRESLHKDFAFDIAAAGAAGDLREQLEGAFARAEIRLMQREVGVNDADERDVWKMQTFRDHLRADEDVDFARAKIAEHVAVIVLALHHVGVHALDARLGKKFRERFLDFFRAGAGKTDRGIFAFFVRADRRNFFDVAADVTDKLLVNAMVSERDAAVRAVRDETAFRALQRSGVAAPVQK